MRRIIAGTFAAAALIFGMTACDSSTEKADDPADNSASSFLDDSSNEEADADPEPEPDPADMSVGFGDTHTWEDNVSVTVKRPVEFSASDDTFGGEGYPHLVKFEVTVQNDSNQPVDLSLFDYEVMSNGTVGESDVTDSDQGVDMSPNASVMPGKSMTFTLGAGVQGLNNLTVLAAPNWDYQQLSFGA